MYAYDSTPLDPEEERQKRLDAFAALAAEGHQPPAAEVDREAPVELPARVSPDVADVGLPGDSGSLSTDPDQDGDNDPPGIPDTDPTSGIANTPLQDVHDEQPTATGANAHDPAAAIIARAASALASFNNPPADTGTPPEPEAALAQPRPGRGPSDAERSPTAEELPSKDGTPAPPSGQVQAQTPEEAKTATKTDPYDPIAALMQKGEEEKKKALAQIGERPGVNGWALLADVAFNKGRSIPTILQQSDAAGRAYDDDKRKMLLGGAGSDPVNQMLAMERVRNTQRSLEQGDKRLTAAEQKKANAEEQNKTNVQAFLKLYDSVLSDDEKDALGNADAATFRTLSPMLRTKYGNLESTQNEVARGERKKAEEHTHGVNGANHEDIANTVDDVSQKARAQYGEQYKAQAEYAPDKPLTPKELDEKRRADEAAARAEKQASDAEAERKRVATRQERLDAEGREDKNATLANKFAADTRKQREAGKILDEVENAIAAAESNKGKTGGFAPGLGAEQIAGGVSKAPMPQWMRGLTGAVARMTGDQETADYQQQALDNQKRLQRLGQSLYRIDTGASGNAREELANQIATATSPTAAMPEIRSALGVIRNILQSDIAGAANKPELAAEVLRRNGMDPVRWGITTSAPAAQPSAASADTELAPGADNPEATPNLGVTSGKLPKVKDVIAAPPTASAPGTYRVTVTHNDGTTEEADLNDEQIQKLLQSGKVRSIR